MLDDKTDETNGLPDGTKIEIRQLPTVRTGNGGIVGGLSIRAVIERELARHLQPPVIPPSDRISDLD